MAENYKIWVERWGGWSIIGVLCAIPVVRWLIMLPLGDRFVDSYSTFTSLGRIVGLVGFVLFGLNMVLSVRKRWLENFFGGLNRVYIAHHITGAIALVFVMFHPLFLALRYIDLHTLLSLRDAAHFLLPRGLDFNGTFYDVEQAAAINNGIIAFIGMVGLLFVTFFTKLPYRVWLVTHKFLGLAFVFAGLHVLFVSSDVTNDTMLRVYFALITTVGLTAYIYRSLLGNIFVRRAAYQVETVDILSHDIVVVGMKPLERPVDFTPGQFVFVRFLWAKGDGIIKEAHPFSITSTPKDDGLIRLCMKGLGDFTKSVQHLKIGTVAEVEGAFGRFLPSRYNRTPQVWIAGGVGITPFLSMARDFSAANPPVTLFYSVVAREELLDQQILAEYLPSKYPNFHYVAYVSQEQKGHLNADFVAQTVPNLAACEIFICGPPPMMKALRVQLRAKGIANSKIHTEEFAMS